MMSSMTRRGRLAWLIPLLLTGCESSPLLAPTDSTIVVVASRAELSLGIGEDSVITARVTESGGTAVPNGTIVTFSTTLGSFDRQEAETEQGAASVRLRAGQREGTAQVRAFSGTASSEAISVQIGGSGRLIVLSSNLPSIPLNTSAEITATATEEDGDPVADGTLVIFSTTLGTLAPASATTRNGRATVRLQAGITPGRATITASIGTLAATPIEVQIGASGS